ncbi:adenylyl-sulfate kinase [Paenibacillus sp. YIM B09110]|uniref:adenylyl-sulfate kinase n=1 Tax=Paenibacillus sp. YIM B09110 TaxID=3126102 RepID=UPI00301DF348
MAEGDNHIKRHSYTVTKELYNRRFGHMSGVIWITGLSGSGKSSIANELNTMLYERHIYSIVLDGDNLRLGLNKDLGFSTKDRRENVRRTAEVAKLLVQAGAIVIVALVSPIRADRDMAKSMFEEGEFVEVYADCPLAVCEQRDSKGLYRKARTNEIAHFTGISSPYEPPSNPDIRLSSDLLSVKQAAGTIMYYLFENTSV